MSYKNPKCPKCSKRTKKAHFYETISVVAWKKDDPNENYTLWADNEPYITPFRCNFCKTQVLLINADLTQDQTLVIQEADEKRK